MTLTEHQLNTSPTQDILILGFRGGIKASNGNGGEMLTEGTTPDTRGKNISFTL